jgi:hypothetical protein
MSTFSVSTNGLLHDILLVSVGSIRDSRWRQTVPSGPVLTVRAIARQCCAMPSDRRTGNRGMMERRTVIVEGPLAFRMRRVAAARRSEAGRQIMTLPQLAGRLASSFARPARSEDLDPAIRKALEAGGFTDLESIRSLPGMTRSVAWTLARVWNADVALADRTEKSARLRDLATIEARVRANLPGEY